jgi:hypothetical protein
MRVRSINGWETIVFGVATPKEAAEEAAERAWTAWAWECAKEGFELEVNDRGTIHRFQIEVEAMPHFVANPKE